MASDHMQEDSSSFFVIEPEGLPKDNFKGPEFRTRNGKNIKKKTKSKSNTGSNAPSILYEFISCSACLQQINPFHTSAVFEHPILHVLLCKACNDYYHSGEFDKDEDGIDNYCRWCGDGGTVTVCEDCSYVFCRSCIRRHVSRNEFARIKTENWSCFVCNPEPIKNEKEECKKVFQALKNYSNNNKSSLNKSKANKASKSRITMTESSFSDSSDDGISDHKNVNHPIRKSNNDADSLKDVSINEIKSRPDSVPSNSKKDAHLLKSPLTENGFASHSLPSTPNKASKLPILGWKNSCVLKLEDVVSSLQVLSKEFQDHFDSNPDKNESNRTAVILRLKTLKDLKSAFRKLSSQVSIFQKNFEAISTSYRDAYVEEYNELEESNSTTAKESDSEVVSETSPTKKKMLRKRKVLDARLSSNENESPKKLPRRSSLFFNSDVDEDQQTSNFPIKMKGVLIKTECRSSTELSDTGSSKLFRKKTLERLDSAESLSDIFEQNDDVRAKRKLFRNNREDSDKLSDALTKSTDDAAGLNKSKCLKNDESTHKKKERRKRGVVFDSDTSSGSDTEFASDDQVLPSLDADGNDVICSDSNSTTLDSGMVAEKNKLALENLMNQKLHDEEENSEEEDEDVNNLLNKENKKTTEPFKNADEKEDESDVSDASQKDSECEKKKKSSYLNPLLKVRINSSDSENESKGKSRNKKRAHIANNSDASETNAKRLKPELKYDEALKDSNLSDEDVLLLQAKDDDIVEDIQQSDVDILLSENEKENETKEDELAVVHELSDDDKEDVAASELFNIKEEQKLLNGRDEVEEKPLENRESTTDSDVSDFNASRKKQSNIRKFFKSRHSSSGDEFTDSKSKKSSPARKNRRRVVISDSEEEVNLIEVNTSSSGGEKNESRCVEVVKSGRKNIRKIIDDTKISQDTRAAEKVEMERRKRLEENMDDSEVIVIDDELSPVKRVAAKLFLSKNPLVEVDPSIVKVLKDHQIDGVKFLWRNVIETVSRANKSKGDGCILAHCMGLGKTLQVVTFLHTVLTSNELPSLNTALVICPLGTVSNWVCEFRMWLKRCRKQLQVIEFDKSTHEGAIQLKIWQRRGGVAVMSYARYRNLCMGKSRKVSSTYMNMFLSTLQDPGPDVVVCDEGHVLKNEKTDLSTVVDKIKTKRRIVLTGTPLQNNLIEYHCMVSFIKPSLLGSKKEFSNRFVNPILNGQHVDSTKLDVHIMKKRSHVLHELLAGCVQRKDVECLRLHLTPKHEYVLFVRLSPLQVRLYQHYLKTFNCNDFQGRKGKLFQDFNNFLLISSHPRMLLLSKARQEEQDRAKEQQADLRRFVVEDDEEDEEESEGGSDPEDTSKKKAVTAESISEMSVSELKKLIKDNGGDLSNCLDKNDLIEKAKKALNLVKEQDGEEKWFDALLPTQDELITAVEHSGKMLLFLEILRLAAEMGDKVVAFSQSLLTLDLIEIVLKEASRQPKSAAALWQKDSDYFRIDGSTCSKKRKLCIDKFNAKNNIRARLFLISTRAGGIGINLVGANRAVLFDASWNPTHDVQSIFRIYRFGQEKPCYIYRLIAQGTMEEKIYERQVVKQSLAFRVVDEQQIERHFTANDIAELYRFKPQPLAKKSTQEDTPEQAPPKDRLLADLLRQVTTRDSIVSYHQHDSLLDHKVDEELTEEERRTAWDEYDRERHPLVKDENPLLKLSPVVLQKLIKLAKEELKKNEILLKKCKERPLSDIMLNLKIQNRDLEWEKLNECAVSVLVFTTKMKARLENSRRILNHKLEQLLHCLQRKTAASSSLPPPSTGAVPQTNVYTATTSGPRAQHAYSSRAHMSQSHRMPNPRFNPNIRPHYTNAPPCYTYHQQQSYSAAGRFPGYQFNTARPY